MKKALRFWPLAILIILLAVFFLGLQKDPRKLPSNLIGKPMPAFNLPDLHDANRSITPNQYQGKVWLLNVWASWCVACRQEHDMLLALSKNQSASLIGLNYKDNNVAAQQWLVDMGGNPYQYSAVDQTGITGIDLGIYGVPETFIIDKNGNIAYRYTGALNPEDYQNKLLPLIEKLQNE